MLFTAHAEISISIVDNYIRARKLFLKHRLQQFGIYLDIYRYLFDKILRSRQTFDCSCGARFRFYKGKILDRNKCVMREIR